MLSPPAWFSQVSPTPAPHPGARGPQPCDSISSEQAGEEQQPLHGGRGLQTSACTLVSRSTPCSHPPPHPRFTICPQTDVSTPLSPAIPFLSFTTHMAAYQRCLSGVFVRMFNATL